MAKIISKAREVLRKVVPKRLYKYGMLGLFVHDDRSKRERIADKIESYLNFIENYIEAKRYKESSHVWHSYFDFSSGQMITSYSQIKELEKAKGWTYTTWSEMEKESKRIKQNRNNKYSEQVRKDFQKKYQEMKRGRSFYREIISKDNHS